MSNVGELVKEQERASSKKQIIEAPKQSWAEKLTEEVAKAEKLSKQIKEKVLLPSFTLVKMAELMRISRGEAQVKINLLAKCGYMEESKMGGVMFYQIITDPQKRIDGITSTKAKVMADADIQMEYLTTLQEITSNYLNEFIPQHTD